MIEKINEITGVMSISGVKARRGAYREAGDSVVSRDGLQVSPFAREMANISQELSKIPDVRDDKVKDLKRQIDEGTYNPDIRALAGRLLWAGINKIES